MSLYVFFSYFYIYLSLFRFSGWPMMVDSIYYLINTNIFKNIPSEFLAYFSMSAPLDWNHVFHCIGVSDSFSLLNLLFLYLYNQLSLHTRKNDTPIIKLYVLWFIHIDIRINCSVVSEKSRTAIIRKKYIPIFILGVIIQYLNTISMCIF